MTPAAPVVQIWFDFASPYSYLAMARVHVLASQAAVLYELQPFLLGPIFQAQGWNDSPFRLYPGKGAYMMRDIARLALLGKSQPWGLDFCQAVFGANFAQDRDIQDEDVMREILQNLGLDATDWIARAKTEATKEALRQQVDRARQHGIFGAPTFLVGDEMFWGNDRLEDALQWARDGRQA
ncbi:2-hydroxychromene-2-carboxylate isomerase [Bordetella holmesii]|uniref:DSBA-like thioredoxin domain protein n=2 Tax=Bordetella holmesii TaxID=35814 RepID=A0A158M6D6_9BORD|nr:2-hydroxychromene-2-carboxylate isomerase [Bordetella holmesii]AHV91255.1 DSBA-like thioredoxin domain protein [Bordetella holmesii ATCC 51541]AIT26384.1 DSBA-like thioredoxin domain protein [Bordetella holmesii 44057]EWM43375.1 DSBA-like thioredoxin domain protein [Bordetella holmesii 41130]EWM46957.1 DSBA-like thioredoxin domain protein [Bordetella holmesii 35009]EWM51131.1 DSBA-like thioredoxin domain protein [Bordetella holmesii 70147]